VDFQPLSLETCFCETLETNHPATQWHIAGDRNIRLHCWENPKTCTI